MTTHTQHRGLSRKTASPVKGASQKALAERVTSLEAAIKRLQRFVPTKTARRPRPRSPAPSVAELRDRTGLRLQDIAEMLGCSPRSLDKYKANPETPVRIHARLREISTLLAECEALMDKAELRVWFRSPLPDFGERTPVQIIAGGDAMNLFAAVQDFARGEHS